MEMVEDTRGTREMARRHTALQAEQARAMHPWDNSGGFSVDAPVRFARRARLCGTEERLSAERIQTHRRGASEHISGISFQHGYGVIFQPLRKGKIS